MVTSETTLEMGEQKLTFKECTDATCNFEYTNSDGLTKDFAFSMEYYNPANGTFDG